MRPAPACFLASLPHRISVCTDVYKRKEFRAINHPAVSGVTLSAGTRCSVRPVHSSSLFEVKSVEPRMGEIRWAFFALTHHASETILDLFKMSLGRLRELFGKKRVLRRHHAVWKPEVTETIEIKNENEETIGCGDSRTVKQGRREQVPLF